MKGTWTFGLMRDLRDGLTVSQISQLAEERDSRAIDKVCTVKPTALVNGAAGSLCLATSAGNLALTNRALSQVARAIDRPGITGDTLTSLPTDSRERLLAVAFPTDSYLVRCYKQPQPDGTDTVLVRGLLSTKYKVQPCFPQVQQALRILEHAGSGDRDSSRGITGTDLTRDPDRWKIRLARTDWGQDVVSKLDKPGPVPSGIVFPIVDIKSDDTGGGAVHLQGGLWRLVCNNGSSFCEASAQRRLIHKRGALWSRSVGDLIPSDWMERIAAAVADVATVPLFKEDILLAGLRSHTGNRIQSAMEHNRLTLSTADLARILSLESLQDEGRLSLSNSVSRWTIAQSAAKAGRDHAAQGNRERADLCEAAAGELLSSPLARVFPDLRELCLT